MNLQQLRYFVCLAQLEHYTEAAKQLHITQPTLSHAITVLEAELGLPLFTKQGRNIKLSPQGKEFYTSVQSSLAILDAGIQSLQVKFAEKPTIHLTLLRVLGRKAVPKLVREFLAAFPDTLATFDFHNDSGMSVDMLEGLMEDTYDVAFCSKIDAFPSIQYIPVFAQDLVLIVPKHHPLASQSHLTLADTLAYPQVWFSKRSGMRPLLDTLFADFDHKPMVAFEVSEDETVAGLVAQGFGLAIIPKFDFLEKLEDVQIIELEELRKARIYYAAYKKEKDLSKDLQDFLHFITSKSDQLQDII
ncbi:TPA: LysR family transcriptional regulator [Streptococcus suis]|nr:LysR family transcriptional regulator [Streptococcus suis]